MTVLPHPERCRREATTPQGADALSRVNTSLYAMLDRFAEQQDLETFLGEAVLIFAREFEAISAGIWRRDGPGDHSLVISFEDGQVRSCAKSSYPTRFHTAPEDEPPFARGHILVFSSRTMSAQPWYSEAQRFGLEARGIKALASVPMFVGDRCVGTISLRHPIEEPDYSGERRELAVALANQIAMALEFSRLGEEAREAAVAREQARAALEREAAVARIGKASRASLDRLSREPDLDVFLGQTLLVAVREVGALCGGFWVNVEGEQHLLFSVEDGVIHALDGAGPAGPERSTLLSGAALAVARNGIGRQKRGQLRLTRLEDVEGDSELSPYVAFMRKNGIRSVVDVPMFLGETHRGALVLRFPEIRRLTPDEEGLVFALANQAVLAIELQRLSKAAKDAAVLEERNRIAREIHDTLAQGFAAIRLHLELARHEPELSPQAAKALEFAYEVAGENLVETRRSMAVLKSADPVLASALSAAIDGVRRLGHAKVIAALEPAPAPPGAVAHELLRMAQEAMLNAARHAGARTIHVALTPAGRDGLRLAIVDDGKGFDPTQTAHGFGLVGLRERAAAIDAELSIISAPGAGAEIIVTWIPQAAPYAAV